MNQNSFYFSIRRRHTRSKRDWSSDVCSSDLQARITELPIDYDARIGPPKMLPLRSGLQIALRLFVRRLNGPARPIPRGRTEASPGQQSAGLSRPEGMV